MQSKPEPDPIDYAAVLILAVLVEAIMVSWRWWPW